MAAISQTMFSNAFSWMKTYYVRNGGKEKPSVEYYHEGQRVGEFVTPLIKSLNLKEKETKKNAAERFNKFSNDLHIIIICNDLLQNTSWWQIWWHLGLQYTLNEARKNSWRYCLFGVGGVRVVDRRKWQANQANIHLRSKGFDLALES